MPGMPGLSAYISGSPCTPPVVNDNQSLILNKLKAIESQQKSIETNLLKLDSIEKQVNRMSSQLSKIDTRMLSLETNIIEI